MTGGPHIIALAGLAGSGKDTAADMLVLHAGFIKLAFADALRTEVAAAFGMGGERGLFEDRQAKETPTRRLALDRCWSAGFVKAVVTAAGAPAGGEWMGAPRSPRQIMQWWGTEYRRAQQEDYWCKRMGLRIDGMLLLGHRRIVITDCRFENEAAVVRRLGGVLWQMVRPGTECTEGGHASQNDGAGLGPDAAIVNDAGLEDLQHRVLDQWRALEHAGPALEGGAA